MSFPSETALVLSGGGAYGAFAVGVMKVLFAGRSPATGYKPLSANIFSGTSVGSFNAAIMASYPEESSLETAFRLERLWLDRIAQHPGQCKNGIFRVRGNPLDYLDADCLRDPEKIQSRLTNDSVFLAGYLQFRTANFLASSHPLNNRLIQFLNAGSFIDSSPFHELMHEIINEEAIRLSPKRLTVTATNWVTGGVVHFQNADFYNDRGVHAILGSSALPGIFPEARIGTDIYVDGGVVENTPLNPAIECGATDLHIIYLNPQPRFIPLSAEPNTFETMLRVFELMWATKVEEDIKTARWINAGIRIFSHSRTQHWSANDLRDLLRSLGPIIERSDFPYKTLTIHRYFPGSALGGSLTALDFGIEQISGSIEAGETSALLHDCSLNGCLVEQADGIT
jgi:predicted acylesterase/phospholipase RssA